MSNIVWHQHVIDKLARAKRLNQQPCLLWFTGLSGSGKSTIAGELERQLFARGHMSYLLDGDNVRHGLNKDLGFGDAARVENIRRVGEVGKLMVDAGLIVLAAFISPFRADRDLVRALLPEGEFIEIFVNTPLDVCEQRDPKGLYVKARAGQIKQFTGIDSPYEAPLKPEITLESAGQTVAQSVDQIIAELGKRGRLSAA
jgi:adenylyl-sulfate kinase